MGWVIGLSLPRATPLWKQHIVKKKSFLLHYSSSSFILLGSKRRLNKKIALSRSALPNPSEALFQEGMKSLRALLPLFDTGQGSFYDLRHFTSHVPPNVARWDYHTTHISQLLTLATVDPDKEGSAFLKATSQRWKEYMVGRRARHN